MRSSSGVGALALLGFDGLVVKNARAAEKAGEHHLAPAGFARNVLHQVIRNDAQDRAQLENIPARLAQDRHRRSPRGPPDSTRA